MVRNIRVSMLLLLLLLFFLFFFRRYESVLYVLFPWWHQKKYIYIFKSGFFKLIRRRPSDHGGGVSDYEVSGTHFGF